MRQFKHPLAVLLALALAATSHTASAAGSQQYDIELLVFQHLVNSDNGEVWRDEYSDWADRGDSVEEWIDSSTVNWLATTQYRLGPQQVSLRRSAQYRPVAHLAWRQTVQDRQSARPLRLPVSRSDTGTAYVDGNVTVAVERYLHLSLDLVLHTGVAGLQAERELGETELLFDQPEPVFKLVEQRRMRSQEIHYFDHPRFGVLALITPYEPAP